MTFQRAPSLAVCALAFAAVGCTRASGPTREDVRARRASCDFSAGALPDATLWQGAPRGDAIPIDHIVWVMQENRSFDHYFSTLPGVRAAAADATNPLSDGGVATRHHAAALCSDDVAHSWNASHRQWNGGANDGFASTSEPNGARALSYYDARDLPYYHALAQAFTVSDAHFASVLGPTQPNRMYAFAGTSFGRITNTPPPVADARGKTYPNLFTQLAQAGISWRVYADGVPSPILFVDVMARFPDRFLPLARYAEDLASGTLPAVALVEGNYLGHWAGQTDEHCPADIQLGQAFVARVVGDLMQSSAWPRSALFFTYDEHGGFYDSATPPEVCAPDDLPPELGPGDQPGDFTRAGFRVPFVVVSPWVRRGTVYPHPHEHTSMLRFIQTRWNLPALTARDANADPLLDLFDFSQPDLSIPPLPEAAIDPAALADCLAKYPKQ